jgi:hypothetical protein
MEFQVAGILIREPEKSGEKLQEILSLYGCAIRNRIGLNRDGIDGGIVILDLSGDQTQINSLFNELDKIEGIEYKNISF